MKAWENVEIEMDNEDILKIEEKAKSLNMTFNEFAVLALENSVSEVIEAKDFVAKIDEIDFTNFYIITEEGKPIAKIRPYTE